VSAVTILNTYINVSSCGTNYQNFCTSAREAHSQSSSPHLQCCMCSGTKQPPYFSAQSAKTTCIQTHVFLIYHTMVNFWIWVPLQSGKEDISRNVNLAHFIWGIHQLFWKWFWDQWKIRIWHCIFFQILLTFKCRSARFRALEGKVVGAKVHVFVHSGI
jgi:hypothetical protein